MSKQKFNKYQALSFDGLAQVEGGRNNWQTNVQGSIGAASAGAGIGAAICTASGVGAPLVGVCGYTGAKLGFAVWAGVTGATGGF